MLKPHAKRRPPLRVVSAPAKPEAVFAEELLFVIGKELPPLFKRHWRELGRDKQDVPLDPDWRRMMAMNVAGDLKILTARIDDKLVGYIFTMVGPHLHYRSTLHAAVDMYWLAPECRGGWTAYKFFKYHDELMRKLGVVRVCASENLLFQGKHGRRIRVIFKRLGYRATDVQYRRVL